MRMDEVSQLVCSPGKGSYVSYTGVCEVSDMPTCANDYRQEKHREETPRHLFLEIPK